MQERKKLRMNEYNSKRNINFEIKGLQMKKGEIKIRK